MHPLTLYCLRHRHPNEGRRALSDVQFGILGLWLMHSAFISTRHCGSIMVCQGSCNGVEL
jgi:hypothetical protein